MSYNKKKEIIFMNNEIDNDCFIIKTEKCVSTK